jgi:hypothetical protein
MTDQPTGALPYRDRARDYSRGPLLLAIAILAIVFGLITAAVNVSSAISLWSIMRSASGSSQPAFLMTAVLTQLISVPASLAFAAAGVAFLLRSGRAVRLLVLDVIIRMIELIACVIPMAIPNQMGGSMWKYTTSQSVPAIEHLLFLGVILLLLRSEPVRMLIHIASGADGATEPTVAD